MSDVLMTSTLASMMRNDWIAMMAKPAQLTDLAELKADTLAAAAKPTAPAILPAVNAETWF